MCGIVGFVNYKKELPNKQNIINTGFKHFLITKNSKSIENALFFCQIFSKDIA